MIGTEEQSDLASATSLLLGMRRDAFDKNNIPAAKDVQDVLDALGCQWEAEVTDDDRALNELHSLHQGLPKRVRAERAISQLERSLWGQPSRLVEPPEGYAPCDIKDLADNVKWYALEMIAELSKLALALGHGDEAAKAAGDWLEEQDKSENPLRRSLYQFETFTEMLAERGY